MLISKPLKRSPKGIQVGFGEIKIRFGLGPRKTLSHQRANGNEDGNGNEQFDQTEGVAPQLSPELKSIPLKRRSSSS